MGSEGSKTAKTCKHGSREWWKAAYSFKGWTCISVFLFTRVVKSCTIFAWVARMACLGLVMLDSSTESQVFVRACAGEGALALLVKGCTRSLMRSVLSVSSCCRRLVSRACYVQ